MTSAAAPAPKSQTGLQVHLLLVLLALGALIVQVYLAGRGAFGASSSGYDAHKNFGHVLEPTALVLLIATVAIPATRNRGDIIQAVAFLVLVIVQTVLAEATASVAAFHPVMALVIIGLVGGMLMKDRRMLTGG